MDQESDEITAASAGPKDGEAKLYTQREWDLEHQKWLCRAWSLAAWPFGILIGSYIVSEAKPPEALAVGLAGLILLWGPAAYFWYRYSKATGKWIWL